MERDGLHVQVRGRHRLPVLTRTQTAGAARLAGSSPPPLLVSSKNYPWPGMAGFVFFKDKEGGIPVGQNGYCALFMDFSKLDASRNSGLKHRQSSLRKLQWSWTTTKHCSVSASFPLLESWQTESSATPRNVSHLGSIFHRASIQYGLPGL